MGLVHESSRVSRVSAVSGTAREMRGQLEKTVAERLIVVEVEHASEHAMRAMAETMTSIAMLVDTSLKVHDRHLLECLVDALVAKTPPSPNLIKEAGMIARSRQAVLEGADWLTAVQVATLAELSLSNPSTQPNKWKRQRQIFAIHHHGVDYFPGYGLDPNTSYRPLKALSEVLEVFDGQKDGWGLAYWFLSANSFLGGQRPQDLLASRPDRVIAAARDEVQEVAHG